jgi:hypothetical protein
VTPEPQRLQYLDAMGLTVWVARFRLPNARPTEPCDWSPPPQVAATPPAERLHALLDEADQAAVRQPAPPAPREPRTALPGRARQLLGEGAAKAEADASEVAELNHPARPSGEPLRFTLQVACLDGRWLILLPGARPPDTVSLRLLGNLLRAAGVVHGQQLAFESFHWPQMEGLPVTSPQEEARQGLQAFIEGAGRRGWAPERVLVFGRDATLDGLLGLKGGHCTLLGLPGWQGPALAELAGSAEAKRALWPLLAGWSEAWQGSREGGADEG